MALTLPIALGGFGVGLPILAGIIGMAGASFLLAVPAHLVVLGIGVDLAPVIFPAALPLAIGSAANKLLGMMRAVHCDRITCHDSKATSENGGPVTSVVDIFHCWQKPPTPSAEGPTLSSMQLFSVEPCTHGSRLGD
jgi:hypothetical protein